MAGYNYPYTLDEDKVILRYILDGNYVDVVKGNSLWKKMETEEVVPKRSWQSLKNRFKRNIIEDCARPEYGLSQDEINCLKARLSKPLGRSSKNTPKRNVDSRLVDLLNRKQKATERTPKPELEEPSPRAEKSFFSLDLDSSESDSN